MDWKKNLYPVLFIGLAWPFFGLGYQAIQIRYIPTGMTLVTQALGLFLAGVVTGGLLLALVDRLSPRITRIMVLIGYLLFTPLGIQSALITSVPFEPRAGEPWSALALLVPFVIVLVATIPVALGMNLTRYLGIAVLRVVKVRQHS